ncbi:MAG: SOS response-associated peptidase [Chloroflexota bacterium]
MCGRFTQERAMSELAEIFGADVLVDDAGARYNVAPTDPATVVVERDGQRALTGYRWGLLPVWADDTKRAGGMFNARSETLTHRRAFRDAFRRRRCLVPVDSFYEWRSENGGRQPYRIARVDGRPLALAGLWAGRRDPETGELVRSFTIVTTGPNAFMTDLHNRMPVMVPEGSWSVWLDASTDPGSLLGLFEPADDPALSATAVSRLVNDVRNQGPELIRPLSGARGAGDSPTPAPGPSR